MTNPNITRITCHYGEKFEATLLGTADLKAAQKVVRAWSGPLFHGATYEIGHLNGNVTWGTWFDVATVFDVEVKAAHIRRMAKPTRQAKELFRAPVAVRVDAVKAPQVNQRDGKVPVKRQILHRGRTMTVTYWMKPELEERAA